jgi:hypothetical protein
MIIIPVKKILRESYEFNFVACALNSGTSENFFFNVIDLFALAWRTFEPARRTSAPIE